MSIKKPCSIRMFESDDLDQILQLFHDTVHAINRRDYTQEQVDAWAPEITDHNHSLHRDHWAKILGDHITYVAFIDNQIVGFADATHEGYLDHLFIHKDFQRCGIATALVQRLEKTLRENNVMELTTEASITAKPFFERQGYKVIAVQDKKHRSGVIFRNYMMKKIL